MQGYKYRSGFARAFYGQGRKEGRQEGRKEGRQEGLRAALVALARTKLGELPDDDLAAIKAVSNQRILTELVASLGQARSARKARAVLNHALAR